MPTKKYHYHFVIIALFTSVTSYFVKMVLRWITVYRYVFFICNQLIIYLGQLSHLPLVGLEVNTGKEALAMLCSQKGNCKSVVSLAMHHRL